MCTHCHECKQCQKGSSQVAPVCFISIHLIAKQVVANKSKYKHESREEEEEVKSETFDGFYERFD